MLIIGCLFFHYNMAQEQEVMSEAQRLEISQEEYNDMVNHSNVKVLLPVTNKRLVLESGETELKKIEPLKRCDVKFDLFKEVIIPEDTTNNNNK